MGCIRPPLPESESSSSFSVSSPNNANIPSTIDESIIDRGKIEDWIPTSIYSPIKQINFYKPNRNQTLSRILNKYLIIYSHLIRSSLSKFFISLSKELNHNIS